MHNAQIRCVSSVLYTPFYPRMCVSSPLIKKEFYLYIYLHFDELFWYRHRQTNKMADVVRSCTLTKLLWTTSDQGLQTGKQDGRHDETNKMADLVRLHLEGVQTGKQDGWRGNAQVTRCTDRLGVQTGGKMADTRRRPQLPPNYNIHQMRLIHELKVAFPSIPDETVRLCLKKVSNTNQFIILYLIWTKNA